VFYRSLHRFCTIRCEILMCWRASGGEEFVILLPHTNLEQAQSFAERLRQGVEALCAQKEHALPCPLTVSFGITQIKNSETDYKNAFRRADVALYSAKSNGRNRAEVATDDLQG
jgi:diguanylate cyclase (GGDEF)-like protein